MKISWTTVDLCVKDGVFVGRAVFSVTNFQNKCFRERFFFNDT